MAAQYDCKAQSMYVSEQSMEFLVTSTNVIMREAGIAGILDVAEM